MNASPCFFAKPLRSDFFPGSDGAELFPVETVALRDGQVQVRLRIAPMISRWVAIAEVELVNPSPELLQVF